MANKTFTREQLEAMTVPQLRSMCVYELGIPGYTKKAKPVIIDAILEKHGKASTASVAKEEAAKPGPMSGLEWNATSILKKPNGNPGDKHTTTVHVSSGASSGNFPVAGRTVKEVGEFLREVLNVDKLSTALVNGNNVDANYVIKPGDNLEYIKPAGQKG